MDVEIWEPRKRVGTIEHWVRWKLVGKIEACGLLIIKDGSMWNLWVKWKNVGKLEAC